MNIKRVEQDSPHTAGVACLAMILGTTLKEIQDTVLFRDVGSLRDPATGSIIDVTPNEMAAALWDNNIHSLVLQSPGKCEESEPWYNQHWYFRVGAHIPIFNITTRLGVWIDNGQTAIIGVPSLRRKGESHYVIVQGDKIFDPEPDIGNQPLYTSMKNFSVDNALDISEALLLVDNRDDAN